MGGHFQPLHLCGQRDYDAGSGELVAHVVLDNNPGPLTALNMAGGRNGNIYDNNISTLIGFHSYLLYLVTEFTMVSISERGRGGLQA